jgi:hypothetical protein
VPPVAAPFGLRLISLDPPEEVPFEPLERFVQLFEQRTGVALHLTSGGHACFDLGFSGWPEPGGAGALGRSHAAAESALTRDDETQRQLNELRLHTVLVKAPAATQTYRAFNDLEIAICTNREQVKAPTLPIGDDIRGVFGSGPASRLTYGLAAVSISDLSKHQPKETLLRRVWRRVTALFGSGRDHKILVRNRNLYDASTFPKAISSRISNGVVVVVHGYANDFDDALDACALGVHRTRLHDLKLLPMLFSWPAGGNPAEYLSDTDAAEGSELKLLEALDILDAMPNAEGERDRSQPR